MYHSIGNIKYITNFNNQTVLDNILSKLNLQNCNSIKCECHIQYISAAKRLLNISISEHN